MSDEYLQRTVRKLLIDYGVKKLCSVILGNVREDFLCYSKLMEIKDVDVPTFLKKVVDVAEAKADVVADVKPDVKPEPKPNVVAEKKSDVDVSGNAPGNGSLEVPKESTIGNIVDVSGGNVDVPNIKHVVVQGTKKPVNIKGKGIVNGKAAAPPVAEEVGDMSIDNIGNTNPVAPLTNENEEGEEAEENVEDETSSQGSKKGDQYKQKQRAEQKLKREENLAKGIEPESLLTQENLEQWIGVEGRTYAYIAGKIVGCKEDVSTLAKAYKIKKPKKNMAQKALIAKKTRGK